MTAGRPTRPVIDPAKRAAAQAKADAFPARFGPAPKLEDVIRPEDLPEVRAEMVALAADAAAARETEREALAPAVASLRLAREAAGLTLAEAAARAGVSEQTLCRLETGKLANPTLATLARCASAVGLRLVLDAVPAA